MEDLAELRLEAMADLCMEDLAGLTDECLRWRLMGSTLFHFVAAARGVLASGKVSGSNQVGLALFFISK